eukprot:scaffold47311_cov37-Attheya_sp.AAC.2
MLVSRLLVARGGNGVWPESLPLPAGIRVIAAAAAGVWQSLETIGTSEGPNATRGSRTNPRDSGTVPLPSTPRTPPSKTPWCRL